METETKKETGKAQETKKETGKGKGKSQDKKVSLPTKTTLQKTFMAMCPEASNLFKVKGKTLVRAELTFQEEGKAKTITIWFKAHGTKGQGFIDAKA